MRIGSSADGVGGEMELEQGPWYSPGEVVAWIERSGGGVGDAMPPVYL